MNLVDAQCALHILYLGSIGESTCSSATSTMLRSGSDLIITGGSILGVAIASETVGEEGKEEKATEDEVEGNEKTVVGKPGCPRGVRMMVFVPVGKKKCLQEVSFRGLRSDRKRPFWVIFGYVRP